MTDNLGHILGKKIMAYKLIRERGYTTGLALCLDDGTILECKVGVQHDEYWQEIKVTAPDDDQWISVVHV